MKTQILTLLALTITNFTFAQIPSKVDELKSKKLKAIENIENIYMTELRKLLSDPVVSNNPEELAKVSAELSIVLVVPANPAVMIPSKGSSDKLFVGKSWFSLAGTEFHFNRDGTGNKSYLGEKEPFTWTSGATSVEVICRNVKPFYYFSFINKDTAKFGRSEDKIVDMLKPDRK